MLQCMYFCFHAYELIANNNVTWNTGINTFHIIGICPWTNTPVTLHVCPIACLLYSIYRPSITAHISKINNELQLQFTMPLTHMCQQQICPLNATCSNYSVCIIEGSMLIYMKGKNSLASITSWAILYMEDNDANTENDDPDDPDCLS